MSYFVPETTFDLTTYIKLDIVNICESYDVDNEQLSEIISKLCFLKKQNKIEQFSITYYKDDVCEIMFDDDNKIVLRLS